MVITTYKVHIITYYTSTCTDVMCYLMSLYLSVDSTFLFFNMSQVFSDLNDLIFKFLSLSKQFLNNKTSNEDSTVGVSSFSTSILSSCSAISLSCTRNLSLNSSSTKPIPLPRLPLSCCFPSLLRYVSTSSLLWPISIRRLSDC